MPREPKRKRKGDTDTNTRAKLHPKYRESHNCRPPLVLSFFASTYHMCSHPYITILACCHQYYYTCVIVIVTLLTTERRSLFCDDTLMSIEMTHQESFTHGRRSSLASIHTRLSSSYNSLDCNWFHCWRCHGDRSRSRNRGRCC